MKYSNLFIAIPIILIIIILCGLFEPIANMLLSPIITRNNTYIDNSIKDTMHLLVPISVIKATADIIEGSTASFEGGVIFATSGFNIEFGDLFQPILEYINIAWKLLLVNLMFLYSVKFVLSGSVSVATPLLLIYLLSVITSYIISIWVKSDNIIVESIRKVGSIIFISSLILFVVLPLTIFCTSFISNHTTEPLKKDLWKSFDDAGKIFSIDAYYEAKGIKEKTAAILEKIPEIIRYATNSVVEVTINVCKLSVIKLLNGLIFPLLSFLFIIWIVRGILFPVLGLSDKSLAKKDIVNFINILQSKKEKSKQ